MTKAETQPEVNLLNPCDERWIALTVTHPQANIFHHPAWSNLLAGCYGYRPYIVALCDVKDVIYAGLPIMEVYSFLSGRRWISLPFTDYCTPLIYSDEARSNLITSLIHLSKEQAIRKIELRCDFPPQPVIQSSTQYVLHTLPLCSECEIVASRFHSSHRRNIKVAIKRGVRVEWGTKPEYLEAFYRLHLQTRRRQGIPIQPKRFFDMLKRDLFDQGLGFILVALKNDEFLAAAVFLHWQHTLTYKYGASAVDSLSLRPNNLLFWTAIQWGCENGYTVFDMGKTDLANTGLREFKSGWGAREMPLTYSILAAEPSHAWTGKLMPIMKIIIRNSPLFVCQAIGELLYKYFG